VADWGPFDYLAFVLIVIPAIQLALDQAMKASPKAGPATAHFRETRLWGYAPVTCLVLAVFLIVGNTFGWWRNKAGAFETGKGVVSIGQGAEIRGPISITDDAGKVIFSVPANEDLKGMGRQH
jgi:hypothetical protein